MQLHVPRQLTIRSSIKFIGALFEIKNPEELVFNFQRLEWIDPFSLIYVSYSIREYMKAFPKATFKFNISDNDAIGYAEHCGFFDLFNSSTNKSRKAPRSTTYVPITKLNVNELIREAKEHSMPFGMLMQEHAVHGAKILSQKDDGDLFELLKFCLTEILRNVLEHSEADELIYCAQYLPNGDSVSLAVLDNGIGLRKSLLKVVDESELEDDKSAIIKALEPGVTRDSFVGPITSEEDKEWINSGYGLYNTLELCRKGGGFFLASGMTGMQISRYSSRTLDLSFEGTIINLSLKPSELRNVKAELKEITGNANGNSERKPSMSSLGLS